MNLKHWKLVMGTDEKPESVSQYEAAIKWIEDEVLRNGVFELRRAEGDCYDHYTKTISKVPTGRFDGFTCSSQHVKDEHNVLQLVSTMRRLKEKRYGK